MKDPDSLPYYEDAWQLLKHGQLATYGNATSFHTLNPPGLVYFYALGAILESDPRLWELPGLLALLVFELLFLYLIVRRVFGRPLALAAVAVTGISLLGNPGYWGSGHPAFILATLYFLLRWVKNRSAFALAIAVVIGAFGLYTYMGMLPFFLVIPILWIAYRPPISIKLLAPAFIISVLIWLPFLRFEFTRDFVDLRSMVFRETSAEMQAVEPVQEPRCYTSVAGLSDTLDGSYIDRGVPEGEALPIVYPGKGLIASTRYQLCVTFVNLDRNFDTDYFSLGLNQPLNSAIWLLFVSGLVLMLAAASARWRVFARWLSGLWAIKWWYIAAGCLLGSILLWGVLNPGLMGLIRAKLNIDRQWLGVVKQMRSFAPLVWPALLWGTYAGKRWAADRTEGIGVVGLGLAVPWPILLVLTVTNSEKRFWWLWPLELLAVLISVEAVGKIVFPHWTKGSVALLAGAFLLMLPLSYWRPRLISWSLGGYAGESTGRLETADFIGSRAQETGNTSISIGYDVAEPDWSVAYAENHQESFLKGAWIDFLLLSRHGVVDLDQSTQRMSDKDDFRVYEPSNGVWTNSSAVPDWPGFSLVAQFDSYDVYERVAK
ncbi:MAG: hypothetical protein ABSG98_08945 [Anaerolineales bacterium]